MEYLQLEGEIKQVVFKAVCAEKIGTFLGFFIDAELGRFANPGGFQPVSNDGVRDANRRSFVEVIDDLAEKTIAVNGERVEIAFFQQGCDEVSHVILRGFQGKEGGLSVGILKSGLCGDERPKKLDGTAGDTTQGGNTVGRLPFGRSGLSNA